MASEVNSGNNMIHVKNNIYCLRVKWVNHLCQDVGSSWSRYIWWKLETVAPFGLLPGLWTINENLIQKLPPFYASMLHSYAYVNNLFYEEIKVLSLPYNIWFSPIFPFADSWWCLAGVNMVTNIPLKDGKVDVQWIMSVVGNHPDTYLHCCTLQGTLIKFISVATPSTVLPNPLLLIQMKLILQKHHAVVLILTRWEEYFNILLINSQQLQSIFIRMLTKCKITILWDVHYKILICILATPVVIEAVHNVRALQWCAWCGARASILHILVECPKTVALHNFIESKVVFPLQEMKACWIFSLKSSGPIQ